MATPADQDFDAISGPLGDGSVTIGGVTYYDMDPTVPIRVSGGVLSFGNNLLGNNVIGFKSADGSEFGFGTMHFLAYSIGTYEFQFFRDGVFLGSSSFTRSFAGGAGVASADQSFIDEVRLVTPSGLTFGLDAVNFRDAVNPHSAPTISGLQSDMVSFMESETPALIDAFSDATMLDSDSLTFPGGRLTIEITDNAQAGDVLGIRTGSGVALSGPLASGTTVFVGAAAIGSIESDGSGGHPLTILLNGNNPDNGAATTLLRNITFAGTIADVVRTITTTFDDGDSASADATATSYASVSAVDSAPVVQTSSGAAGYTEGMPAAVDAGLGVSDVDSLTLLRASVSISAGYVAGDTLTPGLLLTGFSVDLDAATHTLSISGPGSIAQYKAMLHGVLFATGDNPGGHDRTISFSVVDVSGATSVAATRTIAVTPVDDAPSASSPGSAVAFTEGGPAAAIEAGIVLTDPDSADLSFVKVAITAGFQAGADLLSFAPAGGISGSFNAATGELFLVGAASLASYQEVLRSVTFSNTSDNPTGDTRTITILANDGTVSQTIAVNTVDVTAVNDAPAGIALSHASVAENSHDGTVVGALSDTDPDAGDSAVYTLLDDAGGRFAISGSNLVVGNGSLLDFESSASHQVEVHVTDAGGLSFDQLFTIGLTDVNEAPRANGITLASIQVNSGPHLITEAGLLANASDPDGDALHAADVQIASGLGALVDNRNGTWTYTPTPGDDSQVGFDYRITDGALSADGRAKLDITPVQAAPEIGTRGDDTFVTVAGHATYQGGPGTDTIVFGFKLTDATVTFADNAIIVDGPGSHTTLTGIEIFKFADGTVNNSGNPLVDDLFYYASNHDVWAAGADAAAHYAAYGWHEGRNPNAFFDTTGYLDHYADVKAAGINPLVHYDQFGWQEGRDPSARFDTGDYLSHYPDVANAHIDPLVHFLQFGQAEGRSPFADGYFQ